MATPELILEGLNQLTNWGILTTDADLTITSWNRWLETNSLRPAAEVVGRNLLETFPDLITRRVAPFFRQALEGRVVLLSQRLHKYLLPMATSVENAGSVYMQQSVRIAPLVEGDRVVGTVAVIEDVTERAASDAELAGRARQQAALALLGQQALAGGDIVALLDETAAAAAEALGVEYCAIWEAAAADPTMVLRSGVGWKEGTLHDATLQTGLAAHANATSRLGTPLVITNLKEETGVSVAKTLKQQGILSGVSVPIAREDRVLGVVGVYTDGKRSFTSDDIHTLQAVANVLGLAIERKRLEMELRETVEQLADTDRRKDEFLAMLAHELRNPLAPIRNALHLLRFREQPDEKAEYAQNMIDRQLLHMTRLVDDLMDVSRITRGKVALQKEVINLSALVERAVEISNPLIASRMHQLTVTNTSGPLIVEADGVRISQVIANLLNNAAKYTEPRGRIDLKVEKVEEEAVISVQDTGLGLAPEMLHSVFDLFTQVQGSVSRSEGGLGIGLSLVRSLVQMHGGSVAAFSEGLGRGSRFEVRLPLQKGTGAPLFPPRRAPANVLRDPPKRVLIVDDNVDAADSLALVLKMLGHDVQAAYDAPMGLEAAQKHRPEIVLLDIGLPNMDGLEVARRMRNDLGLKDILLVALTGYGQEDDRRKSQEAGFDYHLVKPVDFDVLKALFARNATPASGLDS